ncbi:MAG: nucleotide sugar dehydrogenase [Candidatus Rokubacteria bacterium]|nr:nucleotide sugar dehydrogenase [Candidatus Rokubacteria bacterium]MBI3827548.1 nucleotide sugar dehydrogenase [Candidatus Rokubacteria bacterium]
MSDRSAAEELHERLSGTPTIGVVGLGYVGLPLAVAFAESGARVVGIDLDPARVAGVTGGRSFVEDVPTEALRRLVASGRLSATDDFAVLKDADAIVICVPTPLGKSKEPDISFVVGAADAVAAVARRAQLVVLESTTYPGSTQEILQPRLEARGLTPGEDVFLAFSPERIDPGNRQFGLHNIPKVVGGLTPLCRELAIALYARITPRVVTVSSPATAEMVKLLENTFRSVNIALANEFAIMCRRLGISVWEVIGAAATKPFGFMPFYPGPGLGGHCLPSDPHYLSWKVRLAGYEPRFISFADEINRQMPTYVLQMVTDALNDGGRAVRGSRILALGVAYKPNVADVRDSPALEIVEALVLKGARVAYADPFVPAISISGVSLRAVDLDAVDVADWDVVLALTAHASFDWPRIVRRARLVIDTRNATAALGPSRNVIKL